MNNSPYGIEMIEKSQLLFNIYGFRAGSEQVATQRPLMYELNYTDVSFTFAYKY